MARCGEPICRVDGGLFRECTEYVLSLGPFGPSSLYPELGVLDLLVFLFVGCPFFLSLLPFLSPFVVVVFTTALVGAIFYFALADD